MTEHACPECGHQIRWEPIYAQGGMPLGGQWKCTFCDWSEDDEDLPSELDYEEDDDD